MIYDKIKEKLRLAILKIISLKEFKFFGTLLYNINLSIIDDTLYEKTDDDAVRDIKVVFNKSLNKFEFQIYATFLDNYPEPNIIYVLIHNILHILNHHNARQRIKEDKVVYNIAADHVINRELQNLKSNNFSAPNHAILIERLNKNLNTEQVYEQLLKEKDPESSKTETKKYNSPPVEDKPQQQENGDNLENIDDEHSSQNSEEQKNEDVIKIHREIFGFRKEITFIENLEEINQQTTPEAAAQLNEMQRSAAMLLEQDNISRGLMSSSLLSYLKSITKLDLPWDNLLEKAILTKITPNPDDRLWNNPRKRLRAHNIILPGPGIDKKLECLTIVIDLSGSISHKNLKKFAGICLNAVSKFDKIWILKHDTVILDNKLFNKNEIEDSDFFFRMKAGGGTSHRQVFKEIEKTYLKQEINLGLVILLTDFISDIQRIFDNYKWTKNIPIINLITGKQLPYDINEYGGGILIETL